MGGFSTDVIDVRNDAGESEYLTFQRILAVDYVMPDDFSEHSSHIIKNLLLEIPEQRIGAREGGFAELKVSPDTPLLCTFRYQA